MSSESLLCDNCQLSTIGTSSTINPNYTDNSTLYSLTQQDRTSYVVAFIFNTYVLPTDVFVGLVANTVSILVFAGKELRRLSSSIYVLSVLTADTGSLLTMLFVWLEVLGHRLYHTQGVCQLFVYLTYVFSFLSVWYMVCITVENYITICHPTKINVMCTPRRARVVTIFLGVGALLLYGFSLFAVDVIQNPLHPEYPPVCHQKPEFGKIMYISTYVDSILTLLVPSLAMILMLIAIVAAIVHSLRMKRKRIVKKKQKQGNCPQVRVAKMLFALSATYLCLNIPSHVLRLYLLLRPAHSATQGGISYQEGLVQLVLMHISYINSFAKFFLFFGFSANFRKGIFGGCSSFFPNCRVYTPVSQNAEGTQV